MRSVFLAHQAAREESKAGLHEQHEVAGQECPAKVRRKPKVTNGIGQFFRKWFLARLSLILLDIFFLFGVIWIGFVTGLRHGKGISTGVDDVCFIARRYSRRVRLRLRRLRRCDLRRRPPRWRSFLGENRMPYQRPAPQYCNRQKSPQWLAYDHSPFPLFVKFRFKLRPLLFLRSECE